MMRQSSAKEIMPDVDQEVLRLEEALRLLKDLKGQLKTAISARDPSGVASVSLRASTLAIEGKIEGRWAFAVIESAMDSVKSPTDVDVVMAAVAHTSALAFRDKIDRTVTLGIMHRALDIAQAVPDSGLADFVAQKTLYLAQSEKMDGVAALALFRHAMEVIEVTGDQGAAVRLNWKIFHLTEYGLSSAGSAANGMGLLTVKSRHEDGLPLMVVASLGRDGHLRTVTAWDGRRVESLEDLVKYGLGCDSTSEEWHEYADHLSAIGMVARELAEGSPGQRYLVRELAGIYNAAVGGGQAGRAEGLFRGDREGIAMAEESQVKVFGLLDPNVVNIRALPSG